MLCNVMSLPRHRIPTITEQNFQTSGATILDILIILLICVRRYFRSTTSSWLVNDCGNSFVYGVFFSLGRFATRTFLKTAVSVIVSLMQRVLLLNYSFGYVHLMTCNFSCFWKFFVIMLNYMPRLSWRCSLIRLKHLKWSWVRMKYVSGGSRLPI